MADFELDPQKVRCRSGLHCIGFLSGADDWMFLYTDTPKKEINRFKKSWKDFLREDKYDYCPYCGARLK